jgi:hypothetical protein
MGSPAQNTLCDGSPNSLTIYAALPLAVREVVSDSEHLWLDPVLIPVALSVHSSGQSPQTSHVPRLLENRVQFPQTRTETSSLRSTYRSRHPCIVPRAFGTMWVYLPCKSARMLSAMRRIGVSRGRPDQMRWCILDTGLPHRAGTRQSRTTDRLLAVCPAPWLSHPSRQRPHAPHRPSPPSPSSAPKSYTQPQPP